MEIIESLLKPVPLPRMAKVRQHFNAPELDNIAEAVHYSLNGTDVLSRIKEGDRVAIAVGSRGIASIQVIVREIVNAIKNVGGKPFIVPAMGSHGGATAEGQLEVLHSLGITESFVGAPIVSSMDVVELGKLPKGLPIYIDKHAYEADKIVVVNRIKPHTAFRGPYESGLVKMISIGLGKQKGADAAHAHGFQHMAEHVVEISKIIMAKAPIIFGFAIVENAYDKPVKFVTVPAERIFDEERGLLLEAKSFMPKIMFDPIDVLVVNELGKDISGGGMDPNITGRYASPYASGGPQVTRIAVLDLTEQTHGNAQGIGMADVTTRRVLDKIVWEKGYANALTSRVPNVVKLPMFLDTPELAVKAAITTAAVVDMTQVRLVRIKNTLHLDELWISESLLAEARQNSNIEIVEPPSSMIW